MKGSSKEWIKRHPLEAYFTLVIVLCFATLFPAIYLVPREHMAGQILTFYLARLAVYSPVIIAIFITRIIHPGIKKAHFAQRLKISFPVWLIALIIHTVSLKQTSPSTVPLVVLIILSIPVAILPAWVISSAYSGIESIRNMLATLVKPGGKLVYYLIALFTFPIIHIVGAVVTNILNGNALLPQVSQGANLWFTIIITFFSVLLFSGGINEESGWRGFAQIRLQAKYSPLASAFILWFLMVIWHIPNDLIQYAGGGYLTVRIGLYIVITILFTWIYNRTGGSILAVAIFHASMNSMNPLMAIFPITTAGSSILVIFAIAVVFVDRMWRKLPEDHPAVYQDAALSASTEES